MKNKDSKIIVGVLLILIGLFAFTGNFLHLPFHYTHYIFSIPGIMMIIGLFVLINDNDNFLGMSLVGIGGFWFLARYSNIPVRYYFFEYWPILLILFGISLIFKRQGYSKHTFTDDKSKTFDFDYIDDVSILSGRRKVINSQNFKGGKITAILGGAHIDLHEANLAEGTNSLEITTLFGGIEIIVPRDWKIIINVTSIFGGVDDKRFVSPNQVYESNKTLVIRGIALFGGLDLKSY